MRGTLWTRKRRLSIHMHRLFGNVIITKTIKHKTLSFHQYFGSMKAFWKQDKRMKEKPKKEDPSKLCRMCEKHGRPDLHKPLYDTIPLDPSKLKMEQHLSFIEEKKNLDVNYRIVGFLTLYDKGLDEEKKLSVAKDYFKKSVEISPFPQLTIVLNNLEDAYKILWDVWYLPE